MRAIIIPIFILTNLISFGQNSSIEDLWKLYRTHDYTKVIEKVIPLLNADSNNVELNLLLGRTYADKGEYKNAIRYLDYTVKNDINNSNYKAWADGYLGTCYFRIQEYDKSKKALKECINLNNTKNSTNYAIGRTLLFGFDDFYMSWKIVETDNFRFHFQSMSDTDIENYISIREKVYQSINTFFKGTFPKKIDFFVWNSREDAKRILRTDLGFANPEFCIIHTHYQQTKGHEMTHVISNYSSNFLRKTQFINEGTAVCFDQSNRNKEQMIKDWIKSNNKTIAIKDVWVNGENYPEGILYPLGGLFVSELIETFGKEKFLEFFKNQTYDNAKLVFGDKLDLLMQELETKINT